MDKRILFMFIMFLLLLIPSTLAYTRVGNHWDFGTSLISVDSGSAGVLASGGNITISANNNSNITISSDYKIKLTGAYTLIAGSGSVRVACGDDGISGGNATLSLTAPEIELINFTLTLTGGKGGDPKSCDYKGAKGGNGGNTKLFINSTNNLTIRNATFNINTGDGVNALALSPSSCGVRAENGGWGGLNYVNIYTNESNITDASFVINLGDGGSASAATTGSGTCDDSDNQPGGAAGSSSFIFNNTANGTDKIDNLDIDSNRGTSGNAAIGTVLNDADDCVEACTGNINARSTYLTLCFSNVTWNTGTIDIEAWEDPKIGLCDVDCTGASESYDCSYGSAGGEIYYNYCDDYANINSIDMTFETGDGGSAKCAHDGGYSTPRAEDGTRAGDFVGKFYGQNNFYNNEQVNITYNIDGGNGGNADDVHDGNGDAGRGGNLDFYYYNTLNFIDGSWDLDAGNCGTAIVTGSLGDGRGGFARSYNYGNLTFNGTIFNLAGGAIGGSVVDAYEYGGDSIFYNYDYLNFYNSDIDLVAGSVASTGNQGDTIFNSNGSLFIEEGTVTTFTGSTSCCTSIANIDINQTVFKLKSSNITTVANDTFFDMNSIANVQFKHSTITLDGTPDFNIYTSRIWLHELVMAGDSPDTDVFLISPFTVANTTEGTLGNWVFNDTFTTVTDDNFHSNFTNANFTKTDGVVSTNLYSDSNFTCTYRAIIDPEGIGPYKANITFYNGSVSQNTSNANAVVSGTTYNTSMFINSTAQVTEVWNCSVKLYTPNFYKSRNDSETIAYRYPYNLKIYTGNNTLNDSYYSGELSGAWNVTLDRGNLNKYIQDNCSASSCTMPIRFVSEVDTQINLSSLSIYTGVASTSTADVNVPFNVSSSQSGLLNLTNPQFTFLNLTNQSLLIRAFYTVNGTNVYVSDKYITMWYSNFSTALPRGVDEWFVSPLNPTQQNVVPIGGNPFFNITSNASHAMQMYVRYNETLVNTCANTSFETDQYTIYMNESAQLIANFTANERINISTYTDFSCSSGFIELPYFWFTGFCENCTKTADWDSIGELW